MRNTDRVILGCLMLWGVAPGVLACTTDGWNGGASGGTAGSPPTVQRFSELCGLRLTGTGYVQDNNPAHSAIIARFYVLPQLTGSGDADLFIAYSSETPSGVLFDVAFDGSNFDFSAAGAGGGSGTAPAALGWNLIELAFDSGDTFSFWVNADATTAPPTGTFSSGTGTVEAVRLGLPSGLGGFTGGGVTFDAYEAHAFTPVGGLTVGDANGNGSVTIADAVTILNELDGALANGQPDCNLSGAVTIADAVCALNAL